jgi:type III pantothenate kinase
MLLVADIGNTHTVLGLFKQDNLLNKWSVQTTIEKTCDEWALNIKSFFEMASLSINDLKGFVICSVVPQAVFPLKQASKKYFKIEPLLVGPGIRTGLCIRYDNPKEVGADRIVNAVAAREYFQGACIIVDFGTATTFDCLSEKGEYLGGIICPGVCISLNALVSKAAKLPEIDLVKPSELIGKTTEQAMAAGILYGYAEMVDGLLKRLFKEMPGQVVTVATGGLAGVIFEETSLLQEIRPNLTLEGLNIIYNKNRK